MKAHASEFMCRPRVSAGCVRAPFVLNSVADSERHRPIESRITVATETTRSGVHAHSGTLRIQHTDPDLNGFLYSTTTLLFSPKCHHRIYFKVTRNAGSYQ